MATAAVPTSAKTTTETFDQAYGFQLKEDGTKEAVVVSPETAEKLETSNKFEGSIVTVRVNYPATFDALVELANTPANDEDGQPRNQSEIQAEIVKLFNNGAKSKVMNRLRAQLTKTDDAGNLTFKDSDTTDGVLDLTSEIVSGSKRVFLTEEQKMWKSIAFLPSTQKESVWRAYLTGVGKEFYLPAE